MSRWRSLVMVAFLVPGCGGVVSTGGDGGTGNDGGPGADAGRGTVCPPTPPTLGAACAPLGVQCEYGSDPNPSCNLLFGCESSGWAEQTNGTLCPPQNLCPASYAAVPAGQDCTPETLTCAYPEGECICTTSFGGPQRLTPAWYCIPASAGCPSPRPDIGTACSPSGLECNYGACSGGVDLLCKDTRWQQQSVPCPL